MNTPNSKEVTVLALVTIVDQDSDAFKAYMEITQVLLQDAGAEIVQHFSVNEVIVGDRPAKSMMIVRYPSREAVDSVFLSDDYKSIIPIRDVAFSEYHISLVEN